jgi:Secretion system C-terminal sorting domain
MKIIFTSITFFLSFCALAQAPVKNIIGNLKGNVFWSIDTIYVLKGKVYVKAGAILTIAPGTVIKGDKGNPGSALIIARGGKINAIGTPTKPIVFTSSAPAGSRAPGDWGGIVLAGNAKNNIPGGVGKFEGGNLANPDGTLSDGDYGGLDDLDNSGTLKYVRIEYAGFAFQPNSELNSLTLGSVGAATSLDFIQCSYGFDDAFEWFGGNVNAKHLIAFHGNDDDFDTDFGYSGNVQYAISIRDTAFADPVSGANAFESDNNAVGNSNFPFTAPSFSNVTVIGPKQTSTTTINANFKNGVHCRRNSRLALYNSIVMGFPLGVKLDGDSVHKNADSNFLALKNTAIIGCPKVLDSTSGATWFITPWFNTPSFANVNLPANADAALTNPFSYTQPNCTPLSTSQMLSGSSFTDMRISNTFFDKVPFRGAIGVDDWTEFWTEWDPQNEPYIYGVGVTPQSLDGLELNIPMSIYPNPAQENVTILYSTPTFESVTFSIINLNGSILNMAFSNGANHQVVMNTTHLSTGIYFVKIVSKFGTQFAKLLIK